MFSNVAREGRVAVSVDRMTNGRTFMTPGLTLPALLDSDAEVRAVTVLRRCCAPLSGHNTGFTGGAWDTFDPSGRRAVDADRVNGQLWSPLVAN